MSERLPSELVTSDLDRILLGLARVEIPGDLGPELSRLLARVEDWDELVDAATWHGVDTLLWRHLPDLGVSAPDPVAEALRSRYLATARRNLYLSVELVRVLKALEEEGIRSLPFKGPVAAAPYGNPALRAFGDVDVVVHKRDLRKALDVLEGMRFEPWTDDLEGMLRDPAQYGVPMQREEGDVCVDLHWGFAWGWFGRTLDFDSLWNRSRFLELAGTSVRVFSDEDQMLHMAMHGCKHGPVPWAKLKWITDMAELIRARAPDAFDGLPERSRRLGAGGILAFSLALVRDFHGTPVPPALERHIDVYPAAHAHLPWVTKALLTHGAGDTELGPEVQFNLALRERRVDRWLYSWRRVTTPRARDREAVPLPNSLHFLYPYVRLGRLGLRYANPKRLGRVFRRG